MRRFNIYIHVCFDVCFLVLVAYFQWRFLSVSNPRRFGRSPAILTIAPRIPLCCNICIHEEYERAKRTSWIHLVLVLKIAVLAVFCGCSVFYLILAIIPSPGNVENIICKGLFVFGVFDVFAVMKIVVDFSSPNAIFRNFLTNCELWLIVMMN